MKATARAGWWAARMLAPGIVWRYAGMNRNLPLPVRGRYRPEDKDGIHAVRLPGRNHATKARLSVDHLRAEIGDTRWSDSLLRELLAVQA